MNYEYNKLLKFLYFEGYADSYEEAEYLLEDLNDDEFEELLDVYEARDLSVQTIKIRPGAISGGEGSVFKGIPGALPDPNSQEEKEKSEKRRKRGKLTFDVREQSDIENFVLSHLISEGYANSYDSAIAIYESMSDEWINDILEVFKGEGEEYEEYYQKDRGHDDDRDDRKDEAASRNNYRNNFIQRPDKRPNKNIPSIAKKRGHKK